MPSSRLSLTALLVLASATLALTLGCRSGAERYSRSLVSDGLEERMGLGLGPVGGLGETAVPPGVDPTDGIDEDESVAWALWNNAAFQEAIATLGYQRADLVQAGLLPNPVFSILFPLGPKQLEFALKLPLEALILRHQRMSVARLAAERGARALVLSGLDLIRDVRRDWVDLILARDRRSVALEQARVLEEIAGLSEARLRAGDTSELETDTARADALRARLEVTRAEHAIVLAEERLFWRLGGPPLGREDLRPEGARDGVPVELADVDPDRLIREALAARPDLRAAELAIEEAGRSLGLSRWELLAISGILDANGQGSQGFEMGPGLEVTIPILHQNDGRAARARADLEVAARSYVTVRNGIIAEVREARERLLQSGSELEAWRDRVLPPLAESVRRAERAWQAGEVSYLFVLEASRTLEQSRLGEAEALAGLRRARADLERAVGTRLDARRPIEHSLPEAATSTARATESRDA